MATVQEALEAAFDHHAAGRRAEAETLYRRIIAAAPDHADAHHLLGVLLAQAGCPDAALEHLDAAVGLAATRAVFGYNRAKVLLQLGRPVAAARGFVAVLAAADAPPDIWDLLTAALDDAVRLDGGNGQWLRRLAALRPWDRSLLARAAVTDAETALAGGQWAAALAAAERAMRDGRQALPGLLMRLGQAAAAAGDDAAAAAAYRRVEAVAPGAAAGFTAASLMALRGAGHRPPPPRAPADHPAARLQFSRLGSAGRFGNQILQYGVARLAAAQRGLTLETPEWVGRVLFGCDDPLIGAPASRVVDEGATGLGAIVDGSADLGGCDLFGYFCGDVTPLAAQRDAFRRCFAPVPELAAALRQAETLARRDGATLVALHLRRGDFDGRRYWIAPERWYLDWLAAVWPNLDRPALYIATDAPELVAAFARYAPRSLADVVGALPSAPYFIDHWLLRRAEALAISNSTFSFSAAMLNDHGTVMVRPDIGVGRLERFDPWRSPAFLER